MVVRGQGVDVAEGLECGIRVEVLPGGGRAGPPGTSPSCGSGVAAVLPGAPGGCSAELGEEVEAGGGRLVALLPVGWLLQLLPILGLDWR